MALLVNESLGHAMALEHIVTQDGGGNGEGRDSEGSKHGGELTG